MKKCIDCRNCLKACASQSVSAVWLKNYGYKETIAKKDDRFCIYCGQCLAHCPTGAISTNKKGYRQVKSMLDNKNLCKVAQIAPSIRVSIGEEFGLDYGRVTTEKIVSALKKAGFDYVFDTALAADITTIEEAKELLQRIESQEKLPLLTSCCPAWVRYLGVYYPKLLPFLTSVHSPQMIMGRLIKFYWAEKLKISKHKVRVISIMPCIAKKWESQRFDFRIDGLWPVDEVLTTVETAKLLKEKNIDFKKLKDLKMDHPLGKPTGAGVIYGASGGVMISALRTAYYLKTGKDVNLLKFDDIKTIDGFKTMKLDIGKTKINIAAIDGLGNFEKIYGHLDKFDYIEVMACRGGCVGGGGQPSPVNDIIRQKRRQSLFLLDKKAKLRYSYKNQIVKKIYKDFLTSEKITHQICHHEVGRML